MCIYQIKTNPVSLPPAPAGGRAPAALVTLDNLGPIARPSWRRRPIQTSALPLVAYVTSGDLMNASEPHFLYL